MYSIERCGIFQRNVIVTSWVIEGVMEDGRKFRPSDWVERLSTVLASFGPDHRLRYNRHVQPCYIGGQKCLLVDGSLECQDPGAFAFVQNFAKSNRLRMSKRVRASEPSEE